MEVELDDPPMGTSAATRTSAATKDIGGESDIARSRRGVLDGHITQVADDVPVGRKIIAGIDEQFPLLAQDIFLGLPKISRTIS